MRTLHKPLMSGGSFRSGPDKKQHRKDVRKLPLQHHVVQGRFSFLPFNLSLEGAGLLSTLLPSLAAYTDQKYVTRSGLDRALRVTWYQCSHLDDYLLFLFSLRNHCCGTQESTIIFLP